VSSNYVNFRAKIPEVLIRLGKFKEALIYMKKFPNSRDSTSSTYDWNLNEALILFKLAKHPEELYEKIFHEEDPLSKLAKFLSFAVEFVSYLNGEILLPHEKISAMGTSTSSFGIVIPPKSFLACYVRSNKDLWLENKGAVKWISKNVYTLCLLDCVNIFPPTLNYLGGFGMDHGVEALRHFFKTKDIFLDPKASIDGSRIINMLILQCPFNFLKYYVEELGGSVESKYFLQPIHQACYYDHSVEIIEFLIVKGANAIKKYPKVGSAYDMALNQANWLIIKLLISKYKELRSKENLVYAFKMLCGSGCYICLEGGQKCKRCLTDSQPHSKNASFPLSVKTLVENGLNFVPDENGHPLEDYLANLLGKKGLIKPKHHHEGNHVHDQNCGHSVNCAHCGRVDGLKKCSGCHRVSYCSRECQVSDWKKHKPMCKK
jgi:hypothetical protein